MISWFTRTAADHERGTAPSRCFPACAPARVDSRERVISLSVVTTRLSMRSLNFPFSVNDQGCQLTLIVPDGKSTYQKQSRQERPLALYQTCGGKILRTLCVHWPEHLRYIEVRQRTCREELGRQLGQIWLIRESLALKLTSVS
jgi:hypothetical protein